MTDMLTLSGVHTHIGPYHILHGVDFAVPEGQTTMLLGRNGAGKSTLFGLLNGQVRPDAGTVRLAGRDVTGWPPRRVARAGVGRTFQVAATFGSMTVREKASYRLGCRTASAAAKAASRSASGRKPRSTTRSATAAGGRTAPPPIVTSV